MKIKFYLFLLTLAIIPIVVANPMVKFQEIEHKQPKYIQRQSDAWKEGSRVIGEVKYTPDNFTIKFSHVGTKKVIYTYKNPARLSIYQTKRLPPGTYDMLIESEGFQPYTIRNVKLLARKDCLINLIFGQRVYDNR